jgi:hypothetical protein
MDYQNTLLLNLSSAIQATLTALQTPEFRNTESDLISALQQKPDLSQLDIIINELSSVPLHPYDRLLWEHFEPGYKFKTIDDIEDPGEIPVEESIKHITQKEQELGRTLLHNLTCCADEKITSGFEMLSGDKVVCNIQRQKNYLEFFEMVRNIPVENITQQNYQTIINKVVAEYIRVI